jgi:hypothetical protein
MNILNENNIDNSQIINNIENSNENENENENDNENENNIDNSQIINNIENIKNPIIFLFNLISYKNKLGDYNLSIVLKLFIKYHTNILLEYNIKKIFIDELDINSISLNVLNNFYKLIAKKLSLVLVIKKWQVLYNNNDFWMLSIHEQIEYLLNIKNKFKSIYDCSRGGTPYHYKLAHIFKDNNYCKKEIMEDIINRLIYILDIFNKDIFISLDIPLILLSDFYNLSNEYILKYIISIYEKFSELLNQTIKIFNSYNSICIQLNNLINPSLIKINSVNIDSETEYEDIKLLSKT